MLTTYEPSIFDGLNQFSVAKQCLAKHKEALTEAGAVICKHGLQKKVGLALLHKHFDLLPHERLIENIEDDKVYINPVIGVDDAAILPYLWKLNYTNVTQNSSWFPLEFQYKSAVQPDDIKAIESLTANSNFLEEMAIKLQDYGVEDVFGLSILHREALIKEGEIIVETTDHESRSLMIAAVSTSDIQHQELTETLWYFTADTKLGVASQCGSHCLSHCWGC